MVSSVFNFVFCCTKLLEGGFRCTKLEKAVHIVKRGAGVFHILLSRQGRC